MQAFRNEWQSGDPTDIDGPRGTGRKGGKRQGNPCVTHSDNPEVLLIRIGHWLWRWYRAEGMPRYLAMAIQDLADVKYAFREPLRANREASAERMKAVRASKVLQ